MHFFKELSKEFKGNASVNATSDVEPYGLYISELYNEELASNVRAPFWKGIHGLHTLKNQSTLDGVFKKCSLKLLAHIKLKIKSAKL